MSTSNLGPGGAGILSGISAQGLCSTDPSFANYSFQTGELLGVTQGQSGSYGLGNQLAPFVYGVYEVEWSTCPDGSYTKTLMYGNPNRFEAAKSIMDEADKKQLKYFHLKSLVLKSLAQAPMGIPLNQEILNGQSN